LSYLRVHLNFVRDCFENYSIGKFKRALRQNISTYIMKILLLGEASNLHWTLAEGLRALGHDVTVASNGSNWMNNQRDISLIRNSHNVFDSIKYIGNILRYLPHFTNYDIVQIKNPIFLDLKPSKNKLIYKFLKANNQKLFLDALATDYYYALLCKNKNFFRYSDFYPNKESEIVGDRKKVMDNWLSSPLKDLNIEIAENSNGIIACLYEYYVPYENIYKEKLAYIPIPINISNHKPKSIKSNFEQVNFFIGIQHNRAADKGTDILYEVLQEVKEKYPKECQIKKVVSVPLQQYNQIMYESDVLIDQLYSYTPATNALGAMAKGIIAVSGAEPEYYDFIGEHDLKPIINVLPDRNDIFKKLENLILNRAGIPLMAQNSRRFVIKHHDHIRVAQQYLDFWESH